MTEAAFRAALEARGLAADAADREAALRIAEYLDRCATLLREAEEAETVPEGRDDRD